MADLDIFFAKKDKKKVKGRKYDNPDDIAKRLKESEKKLEKDFYKVEPPKKTFDEVSNSNTASDAANESVNTTESKIEKKAQRHLENTPQQHEEEEWKDYLDESQKDLTNLKISKLQIENEEDGMMGYGSGEDEGGPGSGNRSEGVWSKKERLDNEQSAPEPEAYIMPPPSKEDSKSQIKASYVPPHLRNSSGSSNSSPHPKSHHRKSKAAPDITSAMAFPSLSDAQNPTPAGAWGRKKLGEERGFENVKHGSTKNYTDNYAPAKLSTANRFDALSENS